MSSEQDAVERLRRAIDIKSVDGQRDGVAGRYCLECDTFEVSPNEMRHKKTCPIPPMVDAVQALEASQQEVHNLQIENERLWEVARKHTCDCDCVDPEPDYHDSVCDYRWFVKEAALEEGTQDE